jgi:signal recognition particle receptor subunit beta
MLNYVPIKHKQVSFVSNGGKFKFYTVSNGVLFSTPTQPRFSFERMIYQRNVNMYVVVFIYYIIASSSIF